jgi:hypothetical protein
MLNRYARLVGVFIDQPYVSVAHVDPARAELLAVDNSLRGLHRFVERRGNVRENLSRARLLREAHHVPPSRSGYVVVADCGRSKTRYECSNDENTHGASVMESGELFAGLFAGPFSLAKSLFFAHFFAGYFGQDS